MTRSRHQFRFDLFGFLSRGRQQRRGGVVVLQWQIIHAVGYRVRGFSCPLIVPVDAHQLQITSEHLMPIGKAKGNAKGRLGTCLDIQNRQRAILVHIEWCDKTTVGPDVQMQIIRWPRVNGRRVRLGRHCRGTEHRVFSAQRTRVRRVREARLPFEALVVRQPMDLKLRKNDDDK